MSHQLWNNNAQNGKDYGHSNLCPVCKTEKDLVIMQSPFNEYRLLPYVTMHFKHCPSPNKCALCHLCGQQYMQVSPNRQPTQQSLQLYRSHLTLHLLYARRSKINQRQDGMRGHVSILSHAAFLAAYVSKEGKMKLKDNLADQKDY